MKSILLVCVAACLFSTAFAQNDTTIKKETDTTIKKETNDTDSHRWHDHYQKTREPRIVRSLTHDHHSVHIPKRRNAREFNNQLVDHRYGFFRF